MAGLSIIEGPYCHDILDQPRALRETVAGLAADTAIDAIARRLRGGEFGLVVLTGMDLLTSGFIPYILRSGDWVTRR